MQICKTGRESTAGNHQLMEREKNGFSSLIIAAAELDKWSLVKEILPLLSNSAPLAIYHQYLQPLATCMHNLQVGKMAVSLANFRTLVTRISGTSIKNPSVYADEWIQWVHSQRDQDMYQQLIDSFYRITKRDWNYYGNKAKEKKKLDHDTDNDDVNGRSLARPQASNCT